MKENYLENENLSTTLNDIISDDDWEWELIFFKKHQNKEKSISLYKVCMEDISLTIKKIVNYLSENVLNNMEIKDYLPSNPKDIIDKVKVSDISPIETFFNQIKDVAFSTPSFNKEVTEKITGYYFIGSKSDSGKTIYLMKRANPIKNYRTSLSYLRDNNDIRKCNKDIINIYLTIDCIFTGSNCYMITEGMDRFFGLETYFINNAKEKLRYMKDNGLDSIAQNIQLIESVSIKPRASKSYITFSIKNYERLRSMTPDERQDFFDKHYLHYDEEGRFVPSTNNDVHTFIEYLCDETAFDYGGETVSVKNKKLIEH